MKKKMILTAVAAAAIAVCAQAQGQVKRAVAGQEYIIESTEPGAVVGTFRYEWYKDNVLIPSCTAATCTVPVGLCTEGCAVFKRAVIATKFTAGCSTDTDTVGYSSEVTVKFGCGGGHGTMVGALCWADRNVNAAGAFAATPDAYGMLYQWNRNIAWAATGSVTGWNSTADQSATWTVEPLPCPTGWRLPTQAEFTALNTTNSVPANGTWAAANAKGNAVAGRFYGPNSATCTLPDNMTGCVFLAAAGYRSSSGTLGSQGSYGLYWSGSQNNATNGYNLFFFGSTSNPSDNYDKAFGLSVRCIYAN